MKLAAKSLLLLILSLTLLAPSLFAQSPLGQPLLGPSKILRPKPSAFPPQIKHVVVIFQIGRAHV